MGLIDPGSSDCLIKASTVLTCGFKFISSPSTLIGFGGGETKSSGIIYENLKVDACEVDGVRFRVVPDDAQQYDIIIGRNFTELPQIVYFKIDDRLEFVYKNFFPFESKIEVQSDRKPDKLEVVEGTTIPRGTVNFVRVKLENEELSLPIFNSSKQNISIHPGDRLQNKILTISKTLPKLEPRHDPIIDGDVLTPPDLKPEYKKQLVDLLNKYRVCSAMNIAELGCTNLIKMDIIEKPGSVPQFSKPYKSSPAQRETMSEKVGE